MRHDIVAAAMAADIAADDIVRQIRDDMSVRLWQPVAEIAPGAPVFRPCPHLGDCGKADDDCVDTLLCPCGEEHEVIRTAYGMRAQCDELDVRWTTLHDEARVVATDVVMRHWVAEPYVSPARRDPRD